MIRLSVLAKALYGIEASPACENAMARLRHAIASTIGPHTKFTAAPLAYTISSYGNDLDPLIEELTRRVTMLRRMFAKHPETIPRVTAIIQLYQQRDHPGTLTTSGELRSTDPAPPPGHPQRRNWKVGLKPQGPVGLLLGSLHCIGAGIDDKGIIHQKLETNIDIQQIPWQHLKATVRSRGVLVRNTFAATHRKQLVGSGELEGDLVVQAIKKQNEDDARWLRTVLQLNTWSDTRLSTVQESNNGACRYCNHPQGDTEHMLWSCPCFSKAREEWDPDLAAINPKNLPPGLRLGVPSAMGADESEYFWTPTGDEDRQELFKCGGLFAGHMRPAGRDALAKRVGEQYRMNARQLMAAIRHSDEPVTMEPPSRCTARPPATPNVYTDGSFKNPQHQKWALGGFGLWWPGRDMQQHPPSNNEHRFTNTKQQDGGTRMWAAVTGHYCSSHRTELAAGLVAIHSEGPVTLRADNLSFVNRAKAILAGTPQTAKRPWAIQSDGDLWELFERGVGHKGANSIDIDWCKGHATDQHILKGITTPEERQGNFVADAVADTGVIEGHLAGAFQLALYYVDKQSHYLDFVIRIHNLILRVLKAEDELRKEQDKQAKAELLLATKNRKITLPAQVASPDFGVGYQLELLPFRDTLIDLKFKRSMQHVWGFLALSQWQHGNGTTNGSSWHELLAIFQMRGGILKEDDAPADDLDIGSNVRKDLATFKQRLRSVVQIFGGNANTTIIRPARCKGQRLAAYGIERHVPCIMGTICLTEREKVNLHQAMATLAGMKPTARNLELLAEGKFQSNVRPLRQRQHPPWLQLQTARSLPQAVGNLMARTENQQADESIPPPLRIHCPHCDRSRLLQGTSPLRKGTWIAPLCRGCHRSARINRWSCDCGSLWASCATHAQQGFKQKPKPPKPVAAPSTHARLTPAKRTLQLAEVVVTHTATLGSPKPSTKHQTTTNVSPAPALKRPRIARAGKQRASELGAPAATKPTRMRPLSPQAFSSQTARLMGLWAKRKLAHTHNRQVDGDLNPGGGPLSRRP